MPVERKRQPVGDGTERWHGTPGGYSNHRCGCDRCLDAHRATHYAYMQAHPEQYIKQRKRQARVRERNRRLARVLASRVPAAEPPQGRRMRPEDSARLRGETPLSPEAQAVIDMFDELKRKTDHYHAVQDIVASLQAEEKPEVPVKHRRHWCLHCGCTIEPLEAETRIAGRGPYTGQWRYFHADQEECANASRRAAKHQSMFVSGGLVRGKG